MPSRYKKKTADTVLAGLPRARQLLGDLEKWSVEAHLRREGTDNRDYKARAELEAAKVAVAQYIRGLATQVSDTRGLRKRTDAEKRQLRETGAQLRTCRQTVKGLQKQCTDLLRRLIRTETKLSSFQRTREARSNSLISEGFKKGQATALNRLLVGSCPILGCRAPLPDLLTIVEQSPLMVHVAARHSHMA